MASGAGPPLSGGPRELALMHDLLLRLPAGVAYVAGPDLVFEFANEEFRKTVGGHDLIGVPLREALPEQAPGAPRPRRERRPDRRAAPWP